MRTLYPNFDREDALETVLEVPVPEEMFASNKHKSWQSTKRGTEIQLLLGVIGAPLIPFPIRSDRIANDHIIKGQPIERSKAKYIVQQYIAAAGGEHALDSIDNMYVMGKVKMAETEFVSGDDCFSQKKHTKVKNMNMNMNDGAGEAGVFVLWQKRPHLWSLELLVSGCKIIAGSDGELAWRQTPWQHSHASRGPPRPLRRSLQGLDPRSTANLFSDSVCIGEKSVNNEDCFVLKIEAEPWSLISRSSNNVKIIRHVVWGCFSQRSGLLVQLEDFHSLRINDVFWETSMESLILDYKTINGVNIGHAGRTRVSLVGFGEDTNSERHTRTRMEEAWSVEEVDFNVKGLLTDFFMPPADLKNELLTVKSRG